MLNVDYPLLNSETHRDYLIARHIAKYHEFIQTGPCCLWNGSFGEYRKTPIYHYFLATLTFLFDSIYFLELVNLIGQVIPIVVLFLIVSHFFSPKAALVATILFSFNQETVKTALFVWDPHLMLPFLYLSFLGLFYAYAKKSIKVLIAALFLFLFAGSIHSSAYAVTPTFLIFVYLITKTQKIPLATYLLFAGITLLVAVLLQLPLLVFMIKNFPMLDLHTNFLISSPKAYVDNFQLIASLLIRSFYTTSERSLSFLNKLLVLASIVFVITYLKSPNFKQQKRFFFAIALLLIQFLALVSLFNTTIWHYYLLPIFGAFIILLAVSVSEQKNPFLKTAGLVWLAFILYNFSTFYPVKINAFANQQQIEPAIQAIYKKIADIKIMKQYELANFFRVEVFAPGGESQVNNNLYFSVPLEKRLQTRIFRLTDSGQSYSTTNTDDYIFLVCQSLLKSIQLNSECLFPFSENHPNHKVLEEIYHSDVFTVYLTEKK